MSVKIFINGSGNLQAKIWLKFDVGDWNVAAVVVCYQEFWLR